MIWMVWALRYPSFLLSIFVVVVETLFREIIFIFMKFFSFTVVKVIDSFHDSLIRKSAISVVSFKIRQAEDVDEETIFDSCYWDVRR